MSFLMRCAMYGLVVFGASWLLLPIESEGDELGVPHERGA